MRWEPNVKIRIFKYKNNEKEVQKPWKKHVLCERHLRIVQGVLEQEYWLVSPLRRSLPCSRCFETLRVCQFW